MAVTARRVFELAMHLMDMGEPTSGRTDFADTREYKNRTPAILSILQAECYPCSDTWQAREPGRRPACLAISDLEAGIGLDESICEGILPYGLAAHLLLEESPEMASYFQQRYEELLKSLGRGLPAGFEEIEAPYGGMEPGELARW